MDMVEKFIAIQCLPSISFETKMALVSLPLQVDELFALEADDIGQLLAVDIDASWSQEGSVQRYERFISWFQQSDSTVICYGMNSYPPLLYEITEPPFLLCHMGETPFIREPRVSVVGDRFASQRVMEAAFSIGLDGGRGDIPLVCGYGDPVERTVSAGAAATGGTVVLVSDCGLQYRNPRYRRHLDELLRRGGVCLSESDPYAPPSSFSSTKRNRIVSGMSLISVVIGANANSAAMDTAGHALRQGREVVVHEKAIWGKSYRGSRRLVADGARIISTLDDVTDIFHSIGRAAVAAEDVAESGGKYGCGSQRLAFELPVRL